jgi:hypothetical protein
MHILARKSARMTKVGLSVSALALMVVLGPSSEVRADEADAKRLLKAMSDYMVEQKDISFGFDATLEVVTQNQQKLALASSGAVTLNRPNKIRATRAGGFLDVEMLFDGETLTLFGKTANLYTQIDVPGTVDHLVDELRDKYNRPLPAADLLMSNSYDQLMQDVVGVKDLGSGVIDGVECNYLAFRKKDVDFQIWIAQGDRPYPCRYIITSKEVAHSPQYIIQVRDWKTGSAVAPDDFGFNNTTTAEKIDLKDLQNVMSELPGNFKSEGNQ